MEAVSSKKTKAPKFSSVALSKVSQKIEIISDRIRRRKTFLNSAMSFDLEDKFNMNQIDKFSSYIKSRPDTKISISEIAEAENINKASLSSAISIAFRLGKLPDIEVTGKSKNVRYYFSSKNRSKSNVHSIASARKSLNQSVEEMPEFSPDLSRMSQNDFRAYFAKTKAQCQECIEEAERRQKDNQDLLKEDPMPKKKNQLKRVG